MCRYNRARVNGRSPESPGGLTPGPRPGANCNWPLQRDAYEMCASAQEADEVQPEGAGRGDEIEQK